MDDLAAKFKKYAQWECGEEQPTFAQLEKVAQATHAPLGYFFLPQPPQESLPVADFRTIRNEALRRPSPELLDTLHAMQRRQDWMSEWRQEEGSPSQKWIGSATLQDDPAQLAVQMRRQLGLETGWAKDISTWEDALRELRHRMQRAEVMVFVNGVVDNNTHRPLDENEFRGFALVDRHAPLVFVNGTDSKSAQMFTLMHELAHLWLGQGGISNYNAFKPDRKPGIEAFCDMAAAEALMPASELRAAWAEIAGQEQPIPDLAKQFKVSPMVAARRLRDLRLITDGTYWAFYDAYQEFLQKLKKKKTKGGNFWNTQGVRLDPRFSEAVVQAAQAGRLPYREAYHLTGLKATSFDKLTSGLGYRLQGAPSGGDE